MKLKTDLKYWVLSEGLNGSPREDDCQYLLAKAAIPHQRESPCKPTNMARGKRG